MSSSPAPTTRLGAAARSSLSLTLATPNGAILKHFNSDQGSIDLGRGHKTSEECRDPSQGRFRLEGSAVMSSKQAVLTWESHSYCFITDTDSTNGTFITRDGEEQLKLKSGVSYRLKNDDLITFGQPVQSSRAERKCEPTPLRVAIFSTPIATTASVEPRLDEPNVALVSGMSSPNGYALSRSRTLKPGRLQSSLPSSDHEQERDDRDTELWHSTLRTPSRGFGLSEDDLLQSTEEGEVEFEVVETTILKSLKGSSSLEFDESEERHADSDDEIEVLESTQAEMLVLDDSASDQDDSASDMQLDDDEEEEEEDEERSDHDEAMQSSGFAELSEVNEEDNAIEFESDHEMSDVAAEEDEGSDKEIAVQQASRSPSPQLNSARDDSPIIEDIGVVTVVTIEEIKSSPLEIQQTVESTASVKVPISPAPQRLPSPISPEQLSSRALDNSPPPIKETSPELEVPLPPSSSFDPFPPSQIMPKRSGGFFRNLNIPKAASTTTSTRTEQGSRCNSPFDGTTASVLSLAVLDDEVESQASHLPSPTSSIDLDYEDAVDDLEEERNPWASAGDWGTSIFKAAEEDSVAASEKGAESRDKSVSPDYEEDIPLDYGQADSDEDEDEEQDDFGATDELDLDMVPEELANTEWFDKGALEELDDILASLETECPNCATSAQQPDDIYYTLATARKRTFSSTDMSIATDGAITTDASVNTVASTQSPSADVPSSLPIAPLPKRRRIVRDLGHVTLGFGLGVVAAVAGLSALSGAIQAMDV